MWYIHFLLKPLFAIVLLFAILPSFSKRKNLTLLIGLLLLQLTLFLTIEYFIIYSGNATAPLHEDHNLFLWLSLLVYLVITAICFAIFFTRAWIKNERQKRELIETQLNSELNFLKSQINPHFLFNTLNNLFSIAQKNNIGELEYGISRLAGLMRYMIYESNVDMIVLSKEVKNIKDFIGVCQLRYAKDEVVVNFEEDGNADQAFIAPMILMPFVENAFKHGVSIENKSSIDLSISVSENKIIFKCSNDIFEKQAIFEAEKGGIGLENVRRRLQLLYPRNHELKISDTGNKYVVCLSLTKTQ